MDNTGEVTESACCPCSGGATRTPGFWKAHCEYAQLVLARLIADNGGMPIDLGWKTVSNPSEMFGIFWANKAKESDDTRRDPVCHAQQKGSFHLLAAILNTGMPNGANPGTLIPDMVQAMADCDKDEIGRIHGLLDIFNNSGEEFEIGEPWGNADPECAKGLADIPYSDCDYTCPPSSGPALGRFSNPDAASGATEGKTPSEELILESEAPSEMLVPREFSVRGFPNPAGTSASIRYALPMDSRVTVEILDVQGRVVETLLDQQMPGGSHTVAWEGQGAPAGVYFCRVQCCDGQETVTKVIKVQ